MIKTKFFIQYQAMRISNTTEPYWQDRWTVTDKHPAHFIDHLEHERSETDEPPGNRQSWVYRIVCAVPYFGEFKSDYEGDSDDEDPA